MPALPPASSTPIFDAPRRSIRGRIEIDSTSTAQSRSFCGTPPLYCGHKKVSQKRKDLAPETLAAFQAFSHQVFADGALPAKTKQLIAVAVAHVTQCPYCIRSHTKQAKLKGATEQEIMEAIWVAAEMRAGGAVAHSILAIDAMSQNEARPGT